MERPSALWRCSSSRGPGLDNMGQLQNLACCETCTPLAREALLNNEMLNGGMSVISEEKIEKLTHTMWKEKIMQLVSNPNWF